MQRSSSHQASTGDAGHYRYRIGERIGNYEIEKFLGDGTFGRVLRVKDRRTGTRYACKIIRSVHRYIESAKVEAAILEQVLKADVQGVSRCVMQLEHFEFVQHHNRHYAIVFEELGQSLFEVIKRNNYRGFSIKLVQSFARQLLECLRFLHSQHLTHTDLKPENLLLVDHQFEYLRNLHLWPKQAIQKTGRDVEPRPKYYLQPTVDKIKVIDFGGATFAQDRHATVINTRQYRAPEVILQCQRWDEKSDIWSVACILAELYSGDLLFPTHHNVEHLAMIEKVCGPFPLRMANRADDEEFARCFGRPDSTQSTVRLDWPRCAPSRDSLKTVDTLPPLEDLILPEHAELLEFLQFLLRLDPALRPSADQALAHRFFKWNIDKASSSSDPDPPKGKSTSASAAGGVIGSQQSTL